MSLHDRKSCRVVELGLIGYAEALALQQRLAEARKEGAAPDVLLLCEHPHVITLGRNGRTEHLRASEDLLRRRGVELYHTNRGGDITYHGPGQAVGYPIIGLGEIRRDVAWYVRQLEETMIRASADFGVAAHRIAGCTGVWVKDSGSDAYAESAQKHSAKLGAIGVHLSRWVTSHGFACNVATDLSYFDLIVPCGIAGCRSASIEKLLGRDVAVAEALPRLAAAFGEAMGLEMIPARRAELDDWLRRPGAPAQAMVAEALAESR